MSSDKLVNRFKQGIEIGKVFLFQRTTKHLSEACKYFLINCGNNCFLTVVMIGEVANADTCFISNLLQPHIGNSFFIKQLPGFNKNFIPGHSLCSICN